MCKFFKDSTIKIGVISKPSCNQYPIEIYSFNVLEHCNDRKVIGKKSFTYTAMIKN